MGLQRLRPTGRVCGTRVFPDRDPARVPCLGRRTANCWLTTLAWRTPRPEEPGRLYSPRGRREPDTTELLHAHFHQGSRILTFHIRSCSLTFPDRWLPVQFSASQAQRPSLCLVPAPLTAGPWSVCTFSCLYALSNLLNLGASFSSCNMGIL